MDKVNPIRTETKEIYKVECPHGCVEPLYLIITLKMNSIMATPVKFQLTHNLPNE